MDEDPLLTLCYYQAHVKGIHFGTEIEMSCHDENLVLTKTPFNWKETLPGP